MMADLEKYWTGFCFVAQAHSEWFCPAKQSHRVADSAVHRCRFRLMYAMLITIYLKLSSLPASWGGNSQSSLHCLPISSLSKVCALVLHSINSRNILPRGLLKKCYTFFFFFFLLELHNESPLSVGTVHFNPINFHVRTPFPPSL